MCKWAPYCWHIQNINQAVQDDKLSAFYLQLPILPVDQNNNQCRFKCIKTKLCWQNLYLELRWYKKAYFILLFRPQKLFFLIFAQVHGADPPPMCLPAGGCVSAESQFMFTQGSPLLNQYLVHWGWSLSTQLSHQTRCAPFRWVQSMECFTWERGSFQKLNGWRLEVRWWLQSLRHHSPDS